MINTIPEYQRTEEERLDLSDLKPIQSELLVNIGQGAQNAYFKKGYMEKERWAEYKLAKESVFSEGSLDDFDYAEWEDGEVEMSGNETWTVNCNKEYSKSFVKDFWLEIDQTGFDNIEAILNSTLELVIGGSVITRLSMIANLFLMANENKKVKWGAGIDGSKIRIPLAVNPLTSEMNIKSIPVPNGEAFISWGNYDCNAFPLYGLIYHRFEIRWISPNHIYNGSDLIKFKYKKTSNEQVPMKEFFAIQTQVKTFSLYQNKTRLNFNHIVSKLIFKFDNRIQPPYIESINLYLNRCQPIIYRADMGEIVSHEILGETFYSIDLSPDDQSNSDSVTGINFSRIDTIVVSFDMDDDTQKAVRVCALSSNILRVLSGMAGLAYC